MLRPLLRPLAPFIQTMRGYRAVDLPRDLLAGLTVSVVDLPQSMAFALVAGVPPVYGLYTAIILGLISAVLTSSRFLAVGPTNTQSLLVAAIVSRITDDPEVYLQLVIGLSIIKGAIQLAFAAARMGQLVRFVSQSVMIGFTAGAGVLIFAGQLPVLLNLQDTPHVEHLPGVLDVLGRLLPHLGEASLHSMIVGSVSLAVLILCRRIATRIPDLLFAVVSGAFLLWMTGWTDIATVGELPRGLPGFHVPQLSWYQAELLLPGAVAIALLGMLESVAIVKSVGQPTGHSTSADQEFFAQGCANLVGGFFQCIPGSGSFSRTALLHVAGARTRVASMACSLANAGIFLALAPLAARIPLASLAAILFYVAYTLVDVRSIWRIVRTSRADATVCLVTLAATLFVPLTYAIYVGIFFSLSLYLRTASRLHLSELAITEHEEFDERPVGSLGNKTGPIVLWQLQGDLFFGLADELAAKLRDLVESDAQVVILRLKRTQSIDATVLFVLEHFVKAMQARHGHVVFCGVRPEARHGLRAFGIEQLVGEGNIFSAVKGVFGSAKLALARAHHILADTAASGTADTKGSALPSS